MEYDQVLIYDRDEMYLYRLLNFIQSNKVSKVRVSVFSNMKKMKSYISENDIKIVIAEEQAREALEELEDLRIIYICEDLESESDGNIYRYKSAEYFIKRARELLNIEESVIRKDEYEIKMAGIYSPIGRVYKTTFALSMAQYLAVEKKVLYLNFETYSGFNYYVGEKRRGDLCDFIYYYRNLKENLLQKFNEIKDTFNNVDYIYPARLYMDIAQVKPEEWLEILDIISSWNIYDALIMDLSDNVSGLWDIMRRCTKVYTLIRDDGVARSKLKQYEDILSEAGYEDVLKKSGNVNVPGTKLRDVAPEEIIYTDIGEIAKKIAKEDLS